ncbi:MAG: hypothetical protein R3F20_06050 [Planctomycetota bacterium]
MSECRGCGATTPEDARFCPGCGQRIEVAVAAPAPAPRETTASFAEEFDDRDAQKIARELFQAHVDLLRNYRGKIRGLDRRADALAETMNGLEKEAPDAGSNARAQALLEELEDLGDGWDDVQQSYNADSETLDEEFMDRMSELELDVELPERLQAKILEEHGAMNEELEALAGRLRALGDRGGAVIARASGRWRTPATSGGRGAATLLTAAGLAAGALVFALGAGGRAALAAAGPALILAFAVVFRERAGRG